MGRVSSAVESASDSGTPAYPGAKHDSKGYCVKHPQVRLCRPVCSDAEELAKFDGNENGAGTIKYKIIRKICHLCGERSVQKIIRKKPSHGFNPYSQPRAHQLEDHHNNHNIASSIIRSNSNKNDSEKKAAITSTINLIKDSRNAPKSDSEGSTSLYLQRKNHQNISTDNGNKGHIRHQSLLSEAEVKNKGRIKGNSSFDRCDNGADADDNLKVHGRPRRSSIDSYKHATQRSADFSQKRLNDDDFNCAKVEKAKEHHDRETAPSRRSTAGRNGQPRRRSKSLAVDLMRGKVESFPLSSSHSIEGKVKVESKDHRRYNSHSQGTMNSNTTFRKCKSKSPPHFDGKCNDKPFINHSHIGTNPSDSKENSAKMKSTRPHVRGENKDDERSLEEIRVKGKVTFTVETKTTGDLCENENPRKKSIKSHSEIAHNNISSSLPNESVQVHENEGQGNSSGMKDNVRGRLSSATTSKSVKTSRAQSQPSVHKVHPSSKRRGRSLSTDKSITHSGDKMSNNAHTGITFPSTEGSDRQNNIGIKMDAINTTFGRNASTQLQPTVSEMHCPPKGRSQSSSFHHRRHIQQYYNEEEQIIESSPIKIANPDGNPTTKTESSISKENKEKSSNLIEQESPVTAKSSHRKRISKEYHIRPPTSNSSSLSAYRAMFLENVAENCERR